MNALISPIAWMAGVALGALLAVSWYSPHFLGVLAAHLIVRKEELEWARTNKSAMLWHWKQTLGVETVSRTKSIENILDAKRNCL